MRRRDARTLCSARRTLVLLAACSGGSGGVTPPVPASPTPSSSIPPLAPSVQVSRDLFSDPSGQHATEVEPCRRPLLARPSLRRFKWAGSSAKDRRESGTRSRSMLARAWSTGALPGQTVASQPAGSADSASDASAAYDAAHAAWLIATVAGEGTNAAGS